jgi:hypothetical protein
MAKETTVLEIFVASPSDVSDERELLDTVVSELNRTWSNSLGVTLELLKYETHVRPAFSTDPQAVINEQIGQDYDAFIGIFWSRIGTPTPRAVSGSIEEFDKAYSRWESNNKSPEIMVYFKDAAIPPSEVDPKQLAAVQEFKASMSEKGGMYSQFNDRSGFESSVRAHLSAVALSFAVKKRTLKHPFEYIESELSNFELIVAEDEYDDSDYFAIHRDRMTRMTNSIEVIVSAMTSFNEQVTATNRKLQNLVENSVTENGLTLHNISIDFAFHINILTKILGIQIPISSRSRKIGFNSLSKAISIIVNEKNGKQDIFILKESLSRFDKTLTKAGKSIFGVKISLKKWPHVNDDLSDAQKAAVLQCDSFVAEMDSASINVKNIVFSINKMLEN